ncbi:hypothetical protein EMCRGX_G031144 [Ephydatia muelleri]
MTYVIIGGGIAGVSCAEELSRLDASAEIILISASQLIKSVTNFKKVARTLEEFDVKETSVSQLSQAYPNIRVILLAVVELSYQDHTVRLLNGEVIHYCKLCICTGGVPKLIAKDNPRVIGIRDTESVQEFQRKLSDSRRIVVVGNGGIAVELVYEVTGCEVVWAIKHQSIGHAFFDAGAAAFFLSSLEDRGHKGESQVGSIRKQQKYVLDTSSAAGNASGSCEPKAVSGVAAAGSALGPDWSSDLNMCGKQAGRHIHVEYKCEVEIILTPSEVEAKGLTTAPFPERVVSQSPRLLGDVKRSRLDEDWPVYVQLTNSKVFGCDLIVSATGVMPNGAAFAKWCRDGEGEMKLAEDGGIVVDPEMRTSVADVYAAGDVCTPTWSQQSPLWFQMRLWTQARQMGTYAARCMVAHSRGEEISLDFCFELFAHSTKFFGFKVILLGKYNGQGLGEDCEVLLRYTKGLEYVKVVVHGGKMVGAVLIGDTDLEETFENLILNQMDITRFGESLLDPDIDIEDYFD